MFYVCGGQQKHTVHIVHNITAANLMQRVFIAHLFVRPFTFNLLTRVPLYFSTTLGGDAATFLQHVSRPSIFTHHRIRTHSVFHLGPHLANERPYIRDEKNHRQPSSMRHHHHPTRLAVATAK